MCVSNDLFSTIFKKFLFFPSSWKGSACQEIDARHWWNWCRSLNPPNDVHFFPSQLLLDKIYRYLPTLWMWLLYMPFCVFRCVADGICLHDYTAYDLWVHSCLYVSHIRDLVIYIVYVGMLLFLGRLRVCPEIMNHCLCKLGLVIIIIFPLLQNKNPWARTHTDIYFKLIMLGILSPFFNSCELRLRLEYIILFPNL